MNTFLSQSQSPSSVDVDVQYPDNDCTCFAGPVYGWMIQEFKNGTLHLYRHCVCCGARARSPVKRESISLQKWRELLKQSGREVR